MNRVRNSYTGEPVAEYLCSGCNQTKPVGEFYKPDKGKRLPRQPCKACSRARNRSNYLKPDHTTGRTGYDRVYEAVLRKAHGLTLDEYEAMERAQGRRCAICQRPETKRRRNGERYRLAVDHDHATDSVRALLCHRCNLVVWALEDNHTLIDAVKAYVTHHRGTFADRP